MSDFISDEEMAKMEQDSATTQDSSPDFISDDEMNQIDPTPSSQPMGQLPSAAIGGAVGGIAGYGLQKLGNAAVEGVKNFAGPLERSQVDFISDNRDLYKNAENLDGLLQQFKGMQDTVSNRKSGAAQDIIQGYKNVAEDVSQAGFKNAQAAKDFLASPEALGISKEQYFKSLGNALNKPGSVATFSPEVRAQAAVEAASKQINQLKVLQSQADELAQGLQFAGPNTDLNTVLAMKNQLEIKNREIEKLKSSIPQISQEAATKAQGFPAEVIKSNPELKDKMLLENYQKQAEQAAELARQLPGNTINPEVAGGKYGLVNQLRANANYNTVPGADTPDQAMAKNLGAEIRKVLGEVNPEYDKLQQTSSRAISLGESMGYNPNDFEDGKLIMTDSQANKVAKIMAEPEKYPEEFAQLQKQMEGAEEFSTRVPSPELQSDLSKYSQLEQEFNKFKDTTPGENKLIKAAANSSSPEYKALAPAIESGFSALQTPDAMKGSEFLDNINAAKIKGDISDAGKLSNYTKRLGIGTATKAGLGGLIGGQGTQSGTGAIVGAAAGAGLDLYGAKLQELAALGDSTKLGKLASVINKSLPGVLGAGGAALGAMNAAQAGELTPEEAGVVGTVEAFNPIPLTDTVSAAVEAKKAYKDSNSLVDAGIAGAKGFVSPVPFVAGLAKDAAESIGTNLSNNARSRMEQNMSAGDKVEKKVLNGGKALQQATPDQLMELTEQFKGIKGADNFVAPLENAAQASSDEERQARLFGLYQQPAFRQLLKKNGN